MHFNKTELFHIASLPSHEFNKEGVLIFLEKKDGFFKRNSVYIERWCRLRGNLLFYFKTKECDSEPIGVLVLENYQVIEEESHNLPCSFTLICEESSQVIAALSCREKAVWISALQRSSFNHLRSQIDTLLQHIHISQGTTLVSIDNHRLATGSSIDLNSAPLIEVGVSCDNLRCDGNGTPPCPKVVVFISNSPHNSWILYGQTEAVERTSNPNFMSTITFRACDGVDANTWICFIVSDVRERVTDTFVHLGKTLVSFEILAQAERKTRLFLLSPNKDTVGFLTLNILHTDKNYSSGNCQATPKHNQVSNSLESSTRRRTQSLPPRLSCRAKYPSLDSMKFVYENPTVATYRFHSGLGGDISVMEIMSEPVLCFKFPQQLLRLWIAEEQEYLEEISCLGDLMENWSRNQNLLLQQHTTLINTYGIAIGSLESKFQSDCFYKKSVDKEESSLEFAPLNLHLQRLVAQNESLRRSKVYDIMTVGAFCASSMGFSNGGLLSMIQNSKSTKEVMLVGEKKIAICEDIVSNFRRLRKDILLLLRLLLIEINNMDLSALTHIIEQLQEKTNTLLQILEPSLIEEAYKFLDEIRLPQVPSSSLSLSTQGCSWNESLPYIHGDPNSIDSTLYSPIIRDIFDCDSQKPLGIAGLQCKSYKVKLEESLSDYCINSCYRSSDEPEPWDLIQLNIKASLICLSSKVRSLCSYIQNTPHGCINSEGGCPRGYLDSHNGGTTLNEGALFPIGTTQHLSSLPPVSSNVSPCEEDSGIGIDKLERIECTSEGNLSVDYSPLDEFQTEACDDSQHESYSLHGMGEDSVTSQLEMNGLVTVVPSLHAKNEPISESEIIHKEPLIVNNALSLCPNVDIPSQDIPVIKRHECKGSSDLHDSESKQGIDWISEVKPGIKKLQQAIDGLMRTVRLTGSVFRLRENQEKIKSNFDLKYRRDVCFSQALTSVVTGLLTKIWCHKDDVLPSVLDKIGPLVQFEVLLSYYRSDYARLSDMVVAVEDLRTVDFIMVPEGVFSENSETKGPPSFSHKKLPIPRVVGTRSGMRVILPVPEQMLSLLPCSNKGPPSFRITPVVFNIGINEEATLAAKLNKDGAQFRDNHDNFDRLSEYYKSFSKYFLCKEDGMTKDMESLNLLMKKLHSEIFQQKAKNVAVLQLASKICHLMGGIRFTSCKSAKDRTGLSVTLEEANILKDDFELSESEFKSALNSIRLPTERCQGEIGHIVNRLRQVGPLASLPPQLLEEFAKKVLFEVLDPGITLWHEGDLGTNWYVVLRGTLELTSEAPPSGPYAEGDPKYTRCDGPPPSSERAPGLPAQQKILLTSGSTFGESVLTNTPRRTTVVTRETCQLLRIEQDDFRRIWERNTELMESLIGGQTFGNEINNDDERGSTTEAEILQKSKISSSGEDSEDSQKQKDPQKTYGASGKGQTNGSNWSPRLAIRQLSSMRRRSREDRRKSSGEDHPSALVSPPSSSPSRSRRNKVKAESNQKVNRSTSSPGLPIRVISSVAIPQVDSIPSTETYSKGETSLQSVSTSQDCNSNTVTSTVSTNRVAEKGKKEVVDTSHDEQPTETKKRNIKLHINAKRFSENPIKTLSRTRLSPGTLKKAFQFTRSSSWTQRKFASISPPFVQKLKPEEQPSSGTATPKTSSSNSTPVMSSRRPSLARLSSFDHLMESPSKSHVKSEPPRQSSFDTPEEEDEDDERLIRRTTGVDEGVGPQFRISKMERGSLQQDPSQDLDSPSNAALPILEAPSVRVCEAAWVLRILILVRAPFLLQDRKAGSGEVARVAVGSELSEWLMSISSAIHSRAQAASMWQVLLEEGAFQHVSCEQPFWDKYFFYRFLEDTSAEVGELLPMPSSQEKKDAEDRLPSIIAYLTQKAPDAALRLILRKPSHERTFEDQELIYEELLHLKALTHLSNSVKRELAAVIKFESHMREGTVLFEQGCEGKSWFIIVRGSVDVVIHGKGVVNTLQEGDDFGKLALVNDAPRAATIVLKENNCQFLRVDKGDFNRILRDVEANTVRLKEHGKDVLVLEKVSSAHPHSQYKYTVMAGTPQKMLEHLLETRLDGRRIGNSDTLTMGVGVAVGMGIAMGATIGGGDAQMSIRRCDVVSSDFFLDDFLLTHIVFMPFSQLTDDLFKHYRVDNCSSNQDEAFILACKRRVVHFIHRWVMTISDPIFGNKESANFLKQLQREVDEDVKKYGSSLRDEASLMLSVAESLERYEQEVSGAGVIKWKLPTSGKAISLFGASSLEDSDDVHHKIHSHDHIIFRVYCADHTYCTLRFSLQTSAEAIKRSAADKLGLSLENLILVELKSNGETNSIKDKEVCVPTGLTVNGRLFVAHKDHLDALTALSDQEGPGESTHTQLEMFSTKELAYHMTSYDWDLFITIHEYEFLYQVFGRDYFGEVMCNLDVFRRRFNEIQFWVVTEICLGNTFSKRTQLLRKFIKLAAYCKEQQNLNAFFAIVIGLGNVALSRLTQTWEKLSSRFRKMFLEFEMLIDPSRNHRAYRLYVAKLHPPIIPFTPLLMKDMTFTHEGNRTKIENLVNFEKMHMLAQTLRTIRYCRSKNMNLDPPAVPKNEGEIRVYVRNLHVIDNQRRLLTLSQRLEQKRP